MEESLSLVEVLVGRSGFMAAAHGLQLFGHWRLVIETFRCVVLLQSRQCIQSACGVPVSSSQEKAKARRCRCADPQQRCAFVTGYIARVRPR
jgi:hypothetical protein